MRGIYYTHVSNSPCNYSKNALKIPRTFPKMAISACVVVGDRCLRLVEGGQHDSPMQHIPVALNLLLTHIRHLSPWRRVEPHCGDSLARHHQSFSHFACRCLRNGHHMQSPVSLHVPSEPCPRRVHTHDRNRELSPPTDLTLSIKTNLVWRKRDF